MKNNELLYLCTEQIKHLADTIEKMDSAGVFRHPMPSTTNTLHLIKMAMEDNLEQELTTQLYNLVNQIDIAIMQYPDFAIAFVPGSGLFNTYTEARETLKKVMP